MKKNKLIIFSIAFIFVLVIALSFYFDFSQQNNFSKISDVALLTAPGEKTTVLVIEHLLEKTFDENNFLQGNTSVLLVENSNTPFEVKYSVVRNINDFLAYDKNGDHQINASDPIFPRLHLLFFDPDTHTRKIVSVKDRGIRAILFFPAAFTKKWGKTDTPVNEIIAEMILSDGSRLPALFTPIESKYILIPEKNTTH